MSSWADLRRVAADGRVEAFLDAVEGCDYSLRLEGVPVAGEVLASRGAERLAAVRACIRVMKHAGAEPFDDPIDHPYMLFLDLVRDLVRKVPELEEADFCGLLDACQAKVPWCEPAQLVIGTIEARYRDATVPAPLRESLARYLKRSEHYMSAETRKLRDRIRKLLLDVEERSAFRFEAVDAWTLAMVQELERMESEAQGRWLGLLAHASGASGSKPTKAWQKRAPELVGAIGFEKFRAVLARVLDQVGRAAPFPVQVPGWQEEWMDGDPTLVSQKRADTLRGLLWCVGEDSARDPVLLSAIGSAAERCYKKVTNVGPRAPKIANACVMQLSLAGGQHAITELSRLATRVKHPSSKKRIDGALEQAAERAGVSRDELEDMAVPTCGLTAPGVLEREIGAYRAVLRATSSTAVELEWSKDGKVQKSVPAAVKQSYPAELAAIKRSNDEIKKLLPAERDRLERMCMSPRVVPYATFRERFLDHPVLGFLARRLIWKVGDPPVLVTHDGKRLVDRTGATVEPDASASVQLWHPIESPPEEVLAWREYLYAHEIAQPFKQAHREIYVLTDAERGTRTYSNRFAAHILKQHQFQALCSARGWQYRLQGGFDSADTPFRLLPEHGLRAEFWVETPPDLERVTDAGIFVYVATDQVRFYDRAEQALALAEVPPRVFSEVMRDVDLFVGVASVGNDPNWRDGGERGTHYWEGYAFGELGETARTRRQVLERLLPMLKIAKQCAIEDRFLVVKGRFHQYRIHLGSGNVLMSPNGQYLCIVPDRSAGPAARGPNLRLPFEGDAMLSLILSKAILLANDHQITDPSIQSQIGGEHYPN